MPSGFLWINKIWIWIRAVPTWVWPMICKTAHQYSLYPFAAYVDCEMFRYGRLIKKWPSWCPICRNRFGAQFAHGSLHGQVKMKITGNNTNNSLRLFITSVLAFHYFASNCLNFKYRHGSFEIICKCCVQFDYSLVGFVYFLPPKLDVKKYKITCLVESFPYIFLNK
jgi:hypothetical protein